MTKLSLTIDRIEEEIAVLKSEGVTINLPVKKLPTGIKEGDVLHITISKDNEQTINDKQKAKEILNEILKSNDKE